ARLAARWKVVIHPETSDDIHRDLLSRARISFHRSRHGECSREALEAAAAGALLFLEAENIQAASYLRDRQECLAYSADNLEDLLEHYLENEPERYRITKSAQERMHQLGFETLWQDSLALIGRELPGMRERVAHRPSLNLGEELQARTWQALANAEPDP